MLKSPLAFVFNDKLEHSLFDLSSGHNFPILTLIGIRGDTFISLSFLDQILYFLLSEIRQEPQPDVLKYLS